MNMHYTNVLSNFKIELYTYEQLKNQDDPDVPVINDKDNDPKIINWVSIFYGRLSQTFGSKGSLVYVIQESSSIPSEAEDPLDD